MDRMPVNPATSRTFPAAAPAAAGALSVRLAAPVATVMALASAGLLTLAGCGGGLYIELGGSDLDQPPQVSLVASSSTASPGQTVRLAAAASDDHGVQRVHFFRLEADGSTTTLGTDSSQPFEWDTVVATVPGTQRFYARAVDGLGQVGDSAVVTVTVVR